jgi:hypothetical protein
MAPGVRFTGEFRSAPLSALLPGHWYIGLGCARCGGRFAIMNNPDVAGEIAISGDAVFEVGCPNCGDNARYRATDLVSFQSAQGGSISSTS